MMPQKSISLGMMQPYLFPYIGYFQMIKAVDKYVIYNDVNYIKQGWVNRNYILVNGQKYMFHVRLKGASQNKHFDEIVVDDDFRQLRRTLECNYARAPYFHPTMEMLEKVFVCQEKRLDLFIKNSIEVILVYLGIHKELLLASQIEKDESLKGVERMLNICHLLQIDTYCNSIGGQALYDKEMFSSHGITLRFLKTNDDLHYRQFSENTFVPELSIIDVLMFNSASDVNMMLNQYSWV